MSRKSPRKHDTPVAMTVPTVSDISVAAIAKAFSDHGNEIMSAPEKEILSVIVKPAERLPYPTHSLKLAYGPDAEEYDIPEADRQAVLQELFPFQECPKLTDQRFDLHAQKNFVVKDYRVIRERHRNFLVSPYYPESGGMVVDWLLPEKEEG